MHAGGESRRVRLGLCVSPCRLSTWPCWGWGGSTELGEGPGKAKGLYLELTECVKEPGLSHHCPSKDTPSVMLRGLHTHNTHAQHSHVFTFACTLIHTCTLRFRHPHTHSYVYTPDIQSRAHTTCTRSYSARTVFPYSLPIALSHVREIFL